MPGSYLPFEPSSIRWKKIIVKWSILMNLVRRHFAIILVALICATPSSSSAHHVMGGLTPSSLMQGLLSGLAHPIIGVDHFAFIVGIGIIAAIFQLGRFMPAAFVISMSIGILAHLALLNLPAAEGLVALSVLLIGIAIWNAKYFQRSWATGLAFAFAGTVHGYALAESIVGAEATPLIAYCFGLIAVQSGVSIAAYEMVHRAIARDATQRPRIATVLGILITCVGLYAVGDVVGWMPS